MKVKVKELKNLLNVLPDDAEVEINSIYNEAGECKTSPIIDAVYEARDTMLALTPEQIVLPESLAPLESITIEIEHDNNKSSILKTIVAPEVTGINPETTVMTFEVPDENFDIVAACKKVAIAYCQTEAGKYDYLYMCNKNFNWGDFDLYVPDSFIEQFGFRKIKSGSEVVNVDHNEYLVIENDCESIGDNVVVSEQEFAKEEKEGAELLYL